MKFFPSYLLAASLVRLHHRPVDSRANTRQTCMMGSNSKVLLDLEANNNTTNSSTSCLGFFSLSLLWVFLSSFCLIFSVVFLIFILCINVLHCRVKTSILRHRWCPSAVWSYENKSSSAEAHNLSSSQEQW